MVHCSLAIGKWICALPKRGIWCSSFSTPKVKVHGMKIHWSICHLLCKKVDCQNEQWTSQIVDRFRRMPPPPPQNLSTPPSPPLSAPPEQTALSDSFTSRLPLHLYLSCSSICLHLYSHFILGIKCLFPLYPRHKMLPESRPPLHLAFVFSDCTFLIDSFFYGLSSI